MLFYLLLVFFRIAYLIASFLFIGWHRRLNGRAGRADLSFYVLVPLLLEEAGTVEQQMSLVSENLLHRRQRSIYTAIHGRLFQLWEKYEDDQITTEAFLKSCAAIAGLGPTPTSTELYES